MKNALNCALLTAVILVAIQCSSEEAASVSGKITFERPALISYSYYDSGLGQNVTSAKLNYAAISEAPARFVTVEAIGNDQVLASTVTDADGQYQLSLDPQLRYKIRVSAAINTAISAGDCQGASANIVVRDNTVQNNLYTQTSSQEFNGSAEVNIKAQLKYTSAYQSRQAAPFAILDSFVKAILKICQAQADIQFAALQVFFSSANSPTSGQFSLGQIERTHYNSSFNDHRIYVLGKENTDTDEFDEPVILHEFYHFLENNIYLRGDDFGGSHNFGSNLDARLAFSEGMANAFAISILGTNVFLDSSGSNQALGSVKDLSLIPDAQDRSIYSEASVAYLIRNLIINHSGSLSRLHQILRRDSNSADLVSLNYLAAKYLQHYGQSAQNLSQLWINLGQSSSIHSLCTGSCSFSGDSYDYLDSEKDLATYYAANRYYPQQSANSYDANFWRLSKSLNVAWVADGYEMTRFGGYSYAANKMGAVKYYTYVSTGGNKTFSVSNLKNTSNGAVACSTDVLDMRIYQNNQLLSYNETKIGAQAGCPSITLATVNGKRYLIQLRGLNLELNSYDLGVN